MSKTTFDELSQCILSYHDWLKVDGLWNLLPNYQKFLTNKEHWQIIINVWSRAEHNSLEHNKVKWDDIFKIRKPIKYFKKNIKPIFYAYRAGSYDGYSWSLSKKIADEFKVRYTSNNPFYSMNKNQECKVHKKLIKYEQVLFYNNTRGEKEIVINQI